MKQLYSMTGVRPLKKPSRVHSAISFLVLAETPEIAKAMLLEHDPNFVFVTQPNSAGNVQYHNYYTWTPEDLRRRMGEPEPEKKPKPAPKLSSKPLGERQAGVLQSLQEHGGRWPGGGWVWSTDSDTRSILESLAQRCLVDKNGEGRQASYTINEHGVRALEG